MSAFFEIDQGFNGFRWGHRTDGVYAADGQNGLFFPLADEVDADPSLPLSGPLAPSPHWPQTCEVCGLPMHRSRRKTKHRRCPPPKPPPVP